MDETVVRTAGNKSIGENNLDMKERNIVEEVSIFIDLKKMITGSTTRKNAL